MQSSAQRSSARPPLAAQPNSTSNAVTSASTRVYQVRIQSAPSQPASQPRGLVAARSPLSAPASAPAPSSSASLASSKLLAAIQRGGPGKTGPANKPQPSKLRRVGPIPAPRVRVLLAPPPSGAPKQTVAAQGLAQSQQTQTADQQNKQSLIPVAAGSPPHWDPIDPAHGNSTLVLLSKDNPKHATELAQVQQNWTRTGGAGSIVSVHRVQNLGLWRAYHAMKAALRRSGSLVKSDAVVYHGTRGNSPKLIHAGPVGFDPRKAISVFGLCWFAANASYSTSGFASPAQASTVPFGFRRDSAAHQSPFQQIFQARITLTRGQDIRHETFVVPHAARAYPQYLITFKQHSD